MQPKNDNWSELPEPDTGSAAHSQQVAACIRTAIEAAGGSISFAEYMQLALYAPGLGYYSAGTTKLGAGGDFVTAPEISPLFGRVLARQSAEVLEQLGGGDVFEPGAGGGSLAISMLEKLDQLGALPNRYLILEVSADLKSRQEALFRSKAPNYLNRVSWVSEFPQGFRGVVVANEVADAMPVERFLIRDRGVLQARVAIEENGFCWCYDQAPQLLCDAVREIESEIGAGFSDGYESEVSLALGNWVADLTESIEKGFVFLIDYGTTRREYYAPDRHQGWLRCHFRHRAHNNPLILPGIQDLTSWVDFSAVAQAAVATGMTVAGYVTQAHLLVNGGLDLELADFLSWPVERQVTLSGQVKLLTLPAEMGENFKCIGLARGDVAVPPALLISDKAHLL
jgi:SAM-dependent MidA family methyltransferase